MQIDLVLERNDHTINLFEVKFYNQVFTLSKEDADHLRQVMGRFQSIPLGKYTPNRFSIDGAIVPQYD